MEASSSSTTQVSTKLLLDSSSDEYSSWREVSLRFLESRRLNGFVDGSPPLPPETNSQAHKEWKRIDRIVKEWIMGSLSDEFLPIVVGGKTSRDLWLQLETIFTQPATPSSLNPPPRQDIALGLIERYPDLARRKHASGRSALRTIALQDAAFASGARFNFWERLVYSCEFLISF